MTPLDVALAHLRRFPTDYLFPLAKLSKRPPLVKKNLWENCSNSPDQLRAWAKEFPECNYGIALRRSGLIVADIDTSNGKPGRATFDLLDMIDGFPKTSCVKTPSGGYHLYFRGQHVMRVNGFGPALDSPNYTIVAGMRVKGGGVYRYTNLRERAEAPTWFYRLLAPKERVANGAETVVELDQPHHIAEAVHYLQHDATPAVEGEGGEFRTMLTAMGLRDLGISEETARDLILTHYNERCSPPWDLEGLTKKIANGYAYASLRPAGGGTAEADFANEPPPSDADVKPYRKSREDNFVTVGRYKYSVTRTPRSPAKKKGIK